MIVCLSLNIFNMFIYKLSMTLAHDEGNGKMLLSI